MYANIDLKNRLITSDNIPTTLLVSDVSCKDECGFSGVIVEWVDAYNNLYQKMYELIRLPIYISGSVCRCNNHNKAVGGSPTSLHLYSRAGDISVMNSGSEHIKHIKLLAETAVDYFTCVIYYPYKNFVHCDVRETSIKKTMTQTRTGLINGFDFTLR